MGNLCCAGSRYSGGQTLGGSPSTNQASYGTTARPSGRDISSAAAAAAENRQKAEQARGVNAANPTQGRLAAKLQASKSGTEQPAELPERIVWD